MDKRLLSLSLMSAMALLASCGKDADSPKKDSNESTTEVTTEGKSGNFFISVQGQDSEYLMLFDNLDKERTVSLANNAVQLPPVTTGYAWTFSGTRAIGMVYQQGDPGLGVIYSLTGNKTLQKDYGFQIDDRFTTYGLVGDYFITSVAGQTYKDSQGTEHKDGISFTRINLRSMVKESPRVMGSLGLTERADQIATLSGIVDIGNGEFLTGVIKSQYRQAGASGGSSVGEVTSPDSVWVAAMDTEFNIKRIYKDDRISYSSGRYKSLYIPQIVKDEAGDVYVFSGRFDSQTTRPAGVLRIRKGATSFDPDYYFDIQAASGGYQFRSVWHVEGSKFVVQAYNDPNSTGGATTEDIADRYIIVDVAAKTAVHVTGMPSVDVIISNGNNGAPWAYGGKVYIPVVIAGVGGVIYVADPETGKATKGLTIKGAQEMRAVGRLQ